MNYAITGTRGLIGEYLNNRLKQEGHTPVLEIDNRTGFNVLNLRGMHVNMQTQPIDVMFHLAAHCKIQEGTDNPELPHINNCDGTFEVLEFVRRHKIPKMVNFSSSRVLADEDNPYTASKKYGEHLTKAHGDCYGLEWITVRPSTVYGIGTVDVTSRLLTTWVQNALLDKPLRIFGDKSKTLDFTHASDFVDGIMLLTDKWGIAKNHAYNISGENETNLTYLADVIRQEANSDSKIINERPEVAQPQRVHVDISDMKSLGFNPKVKIEEGAKEMIRWYKRNRKLWEKK